MTIYNFNIGIGWASSGVEYAQAYRSNIFKKNGQKAKFIFTDTFRENIQPMTKNIGFDDEEVIWLYQYFTDVKIAPTSFSLADLEAKFADQPSNKERKGNQVIYNFANGLRLTASLDNHGASNVTDPVFKTEYVVNEKLIQRDYYSYVKIYSEYFKPVKNEANLYQKRYFNEDGSAAYDELMNGKESFFVLPDRTIYSREDFITYFVEQLHLTEKDIVIIDRSTNMGPNILKSKGPSKMGVVVHAEHFNEPMTNSKKILWNNYYDYQFENAASFDFFVTATQRQKEILEQQFRDYGKKGTKIYAIPVGSVDELKGTEPDNERKKNSLITASRLASEKHLDWLIQATVKARETIEDISLDIYGRGGEEAMLRQLIEKHEAKDYIRLMGQHDLAEVYKKYQTYVSASTSEGFGLTLLEAVGSGLGMVGFDVRYGNQTFIKNGENGYLIDYIKNDNAKNIENLAQAIVKIQEDEAKDWSKVNQTSYEIAKPYLTSEIQELWQKLEEDMLSD